MGECEKDGDTVLAKGPELLSSFALCSRAAQCLRRTLRLFANAKKWSGRRGSNPRPSAWKADALPLSYSRNILKCFLRKHFKMLRHAVVPKGAEADIQTVQFPGRYSQDANSRMLVPKPQFPARCTPNKKPTKNFLPSAVSRSAPAAVHRRSLLRAHSAVSVFASPPGERFQGCNLLLTRKGASTRQFFLSLAAKGKIGGDRIRTYVVRSTTGLQPVPFSHSGTPPYTKTRRAVYDVQPAYTSPLRSKGDREMSFSEYALRN